MFELTRVNEIPFKFRGDFKIVLLINGQQTATSTYPCPYCFVTLKDLRRQNKLRSGSGNSESSGKVPTLKTYGDLKKSYENFCKIQKNKDLAKTCESTINLSLIIEDDDCIVLEKCFIPELHIILGFVNHMFWDGLVKLVGRDIALIWPKKLNLISKNYHGEGNACRTLLKNADSLIDSKIYNEVGRFRIEPFVAAFKAMNNVVEACFSNYRRKDLSEIKSLIGHLEKTIYACEISITLKFHVLIEHLEESLQFMNSIHGFGYWSEQSGESIHHEFYIYWERYKINNMEAESFPSRLMRAVVEFSSENL